MSESDSVRYFPLDVERLVKGQVLTPAELEPILGIKYPHELWTLRVLQLRKKIETQRQRRGLPVVTMRYEKGSLVICDDSAASVYNRSMGKRGLRRFARASARNLAVDETKLTAGELQAHRHGVMRQAMLLNAIRSAQHRQPPQIEHKRTTPLMVAGPA